MTMGAAPSHGTTMGYVSDPFRTEEQNPTRKGNAANDFHIGVFPCIRSRSRETSDAVTSYVPKSHDFDYVRIA